jgi:hypothetical protein
MHIFIQAACSLYLTLLDFITLNIIMIGPTENTACTTPSIVVRRHVHAYAAGST